MHISSFLAILCGAAYVSADCYSGGQKADRGAALDKAGYIESACKGLTSDGSWKSGQTKSYCLQELNAAPIKWELFIKVSSVCLHTNGAFVNLFCTIST